jgi:two-component system cell cycle response regulator DivK
MNATILIIEDNEQNRYVATFLLRARGYQILHAENGAIGIDLAGRMRPNLILLDIQLPGMDGYTVAGILKNDPALKHIPIVAVTSYAMSGDREKIMATGVEGYLEKPINPETFASEIESFIRPARKESVE